MFEKVKIIRKTHLIYGIVFLFYLWMAYQVPYTHDDWDWGLAIGVQRLLYATENSRYAGNLLVFTMTRSKLLQTIIMGSGYFLIPLCLTSFASKLFPDASERFRLTLFFVSNCLFLSANRSLWSQTYGWVAGYSNFVASVLFMMPWILEILKVFDEQPTGRKFSLLQLLFALFISISGQLFAENMAVFHVFLAIMLCIIHYVRAKRVPIRNLVMLSGAVIGLIIMFSSSLYDTLFSTGEAVGGYRHIPLLDDCTLGEALYVMCTMVIHLSIRIYVHNSVLLITILAILSTLLFCMNVWNAWKRFFQASNVLICILIALSYAYDQMTQAHSTRMYFYDFAVSLAFFCTVSVEIWFLFRTQKHLLCQLSAVWICAPLIIAPLIVTEELGSRLFFSSNTFLVLFALILLGEVWKNGSPVARKYMVRVSSMLMVLLLAFHGIVYAQIGICNRERYKIIEAARSSSATEIVLPTYPFNEHLFNENPYEFGWIDYFKEFYGIDPDVLVTFE